MLSEIIFHDFLNILDVSCNDVAVIDILDESELYRKPYIKAVKENSILDLQKVYKFPIIKWCGFPQDGIFNFSELTTLLYSKGFLNESQYKYVKNLQVINNYEEFEWNNVIHKNRWNERQTNRYNIFSLKRAINIKPIRHLGERGGQQTFPTGYDMDLKCLIFTKPALLKLHSVEYLPILDSLIENNTIIFTLKKYIDEFWKYPKKFWVQEEIPSILSSTINGMIVFQRLKDKYKISEEL